MGLAPWAGKKSADALDGWYFGERDDDAAAGLGGLRLGLDFHHKLEIISGDNGSILVRG